jgi:hypothetical protein
LSAIAVPLEQEALRTTSNGRVLVPVRNVELLEGALHPQLVLRHDSLPNTALLQLILWRLQQKEQNIVTYVLFQVGLHWCRSNSNFLRSQLGIWEAKMHCCVQLRN